MKPFLMEKNMEINFTNKPEYEEGHVESTAVDTQAILSPDVITEEIVSRPRTIAGVEAYLGAAGLGHSQDYGYKY
jgi:hypothetical protein